MWECRHWQEVFAFFSHLGEMAGKQNTFPRQKITLFCFKNTYRCKMLWLKCAFCQSILNICSWMWNGSGPVSSCNDPGCLWDFWVNFSITLCLSWRREQKTKCEQHWTIKVCNYSGHSLMKVSPFLLHDCSSRILTDSLWLLLCSRGAGSHEEYSKG